MVGWVDHGVEITETKSKYISFSNYYDVVFAYWSCCLVIYTSDEDGKYCTRPSSARENPPISSLRYTS